LVVFDNTAAYFVVVDMTKKSFNICPLGSVFTNFIFFVTYQLAQKARLFALDKLF
jgi:hypothetical protein